MDADNAGDGDDGDEVDDGDEDDGDVVIFLTDGKDRVLNIKCKMKPRGNHTW